MRRLTSRGPVHRLARSSEERGGIAVMLALLMPVLFAAAALAIDTAGVWSSRQQVETGADAAVLAVAIDCAEGDCGDIKSTAEDAMWANDEAGKASDLGGGIGLISTKTTTAKDGGRTGTVSQTITTPWTINHFFAGALGKATGTLSVASYAAWGPAAAATARVPVAIDYCTYKNAVDDGLGTGATATISLKTSVADSTSSCSGYSVRKGTALTSATSSSVCRTATSWKDSVTYSTATFTALSTACTASYLTAQVGAEVLLPVWTSATASTASTKTFTVYGYAAFHLTSVTTGSTPTMTGYFARAGQQSDATTNPSTSAPDLGAYSVFLTES